MRKIEKILSLGKEKGGGESIIIKLLFDYIGLMQNNGAEKCS